MRDLSKNISNVKNIIEQNQTAICSLCLIVFGFILYGQTVHIKLFGDNLQLLLKNPSANPVTYFIKAVPLVKSYRPVEAAFMAWSQILLGPFNAIPVACGRIVLQIVISLFIFHVTRRLGLSRAGSVIAAIVFLSSPSATMAVCDNFSLLLSTFFGCSSLWLWYSREYEAGPEGISSWQANQKYLLALLCCAVAIWSKESGIMFPVQIAVVAAAQYRTTRERCLLIKTARSVVPFLLLAAGYFWLRSTLDVRQVTFGSSLYNYAFGKNVLVNGLMLLGTLGCCWSSVDCFLWYTTGDWLRLSGVAGLSAAVYAIVVWGVLHSRQRKLCAVLVIVSIIGELPVLFLDHVSELYVYSVLPFWALIAGVGISTALSKCKNILWIKSIVTIVVVVWIGIQIWAVAVKSRMVIENSHRAAVMIQKLESIVLKSEKGKVIYLYMPEEKEYRYSIFKMPGYSVLEYGFASLLRYWGRTDVEVKVVPERLRYCYLNKKTGRHLSYESFLRLK